MNKIKQPKLFKLYLISTKNQLITIPFTKITHTYQTTKLSKDFHSYLKEFLSRKPITKLSKLQKKFFNSN